MWRSDMFRAETTFWLGNFWLHISSFVLPVPLIPSSWLDLCFCCCSSACYLLVCLHLKWFLLIREEIKREVNHFMHGMCGGINTRKNSRTSESLLLVFFSSFAWFPFFFTAVFHGNRTTFSCDQFFLNTDWWETNTQGMSAASVSNQMKS